MLHVSFWCVRWVFLFPPQRYVDCQTLPCNSPTHYGVMLDKPPSIWHPQWDMINCGMPSIWGGKKPTVWSRASVRFTVYNCILHSILERPTDDAEHPLFIEIILNHSVDTEKTTHKLQTVVSTSDSFSFCKDRSDKNKENFTFVLSALFNPEFDSTFWRIHLLSASVPVLFACAKPPQRRDVCSCSACSAGALSCSDTDGTETLTERVLQANKNNT